MFFYVSTLSSLLLSWLINDSSYLLKVMYAIRGVFEGVFFFFRGFDKMWDICEVNVLFVVRCLKSIKFLVQLCNLLQNL